MLTKNMLHALPGTVATGGLYIAVLAADSTPAIMVAATVAWLLTVYSTVMLGSSADYWEERYRTHRNCGNRESK